MCKFIKTATWFVVLCCSVGVQQSHCISILPFSKCINYSTLTFFKHSEQLASQMAEHVYFTLTKLQISCFAKTQRISLKVHYVWVMKKVSVSSISSNKKSLCCSVLELQVCRFSLSLVKMLFYEWYTFFFSVLCSTLKRAFCDKGEK